MTNQETLTSLLGDIGDSIRAKTGGSSTMTLSQMPTAIDGIHVYDPAVDEVIARTYSGTYTNTGALAVGDYAFYLDTTLGGVVFSSATSIGDYAFYGCTGLTTLVLPNVTSIGDYAFYGCTGLTTISLPSVQTVGDYAFYDCTGVTNVSLPAAVTVGDYSFVNLTSATSMSFPMLDTTGDHVFMGASLMTSIDFPKLAHVDKSTFSKWEAVTSVSLPELVNVGRSLLYHCYLLDEVTFPKATQADEYGFSNNNLKKIHCPSMSYIYSNAIYDNPQLEYIDFYSPTRTSVVNASNNSQSIFQGNTPSTAVVYINDELVTAQRNKWSSISSRILPHSEMPTS